MAERNLFDLEGRSALVTGGGQGLGRAMALGLAKHGANIAILEINPGSPVVSRLKPDDPRFDDWANLLFDQALLAEGGQLEDPAAFVKRTNELMMALAAQSG